MKYLVALILCAGIFVTLCNSACFFDGPPELKEGETLKGCFHNGKLYELNTEFKDENCLKCSCYSDGSMQCCSSVGRLVNNDPERCVFELDKETCKYKLISNKDPEKECLFYGSMG